MKSSRVESYLTLTLIIGFLSLYPCTTNAQTGPAPGRPTPQQDDRGVTPAHTPITGPSGIRADSSAGPLPGGAIASTGATGPSGSKSGTGTNGNTGASGRSRLEYRKPR